MKVLIINFHGLGFPGGVQSVVNTLIKNTPAKKRVGYRALCAGNKKFEKVKASGIIEYKSSDLGKKCKKKELKTTLQKVWEEFMPDIIYSHNLTYMFESKKAQVIFNFFKNKGCVMIEHAHHAYSRRKQRCAKGLNFKWNKIIVVSKYAYKKISPIVKNKSIIEIVPNSINLNYFSKKRITALKKKRLSKNFCFVFPSRTIRISTGEIGEQKQFLTVIKSLSKLKKTYKKQFNLFIPHLGVFGSRSSKGERLLKAKLKKYDILKETIIYPKRLLQKDMIEFYAQGDAVLFPSLGESFGLVTIEAQGCGLPVIVADSGASSELVKNNYNGLIVKPKSVTQLANAMNHLMNNKMDYDKIVSNGLKTVKKYSSKAHAQEIISIFNKFPKKQTIFLIRHGQTILNKRGVYSGQIQTTLTKKGIGQAKKIREFFSNKKIDTIYCSPLIRTRKTAEIIFGNKKFIYSNLLKEIDVGLAGGKTNKEVKLEFPNLKRKNGSIVSYPGGESHRDLENRIKPFLKRIRANTTAIVAHESVNRMILALVLEEPFQKVPRHRNNEVVIIRGKSFERIAF